MVSRGWVSLGHFIILLWCVAISLAALPLDTQAQGVRSIIESRARVFPAIGAGVIAMKRDAAGRYYLLARPANIVRVYSADGKPIGQIPKPGSGAAIRYAVGIDVTPDGTIAVADRGANAIEVFRPDGSLVSRTPVFAPTSVVALSDADFAVTTLRSRRLVEVIDVRGTVLQRFGDPSDVSGNPETDIDPETRELFGGPKPKASPLHDYGTITGDSAGGIYFAFASTPNPTLRKYDRSGYEMYQASIPKSDFGGGTVEPQDRLQLLFGLSNVSFSHQEGGWLSIGSSKDIKFGANVGEGIGESLRRGYGLGQAIEQQNEREMGSPVGKSGSFGDMFSGEVDRSGSTFQMGARSTSGGAGRAGLGKFGGQTTDSGALLQFSASDDSSTNANNSFGTAGTGLAKDLSFDGAEAGTASTEDSAGNSELYSSARPGTADAPTAMGLPAPFALGASLNGIYFRPQGLSPTITGAAGTGSTSSSSGATGNSGAQSSGAAANPGIRPGYRGGFKAGALAFTAGLRINLGTLDRGVAAKEPKITAVAVDPRTHDVWAAIADTLVEFNANGSPVGLYYLTLAGGESLKATALLVEPDRLLIAADPWGIFEFPRPDKPSAPQQKSDVVPEAVTQPR